MITQIEIDGFKTFEDFELELSPFQVLIGPNGAGKSNLFDAIHLLSRLAEMDLNTAFRGTRGQVQELFTILPNERVLDKMRLAVEMLIDRSVQNQGGVKVDLKYTRLRYEITIERHPDEQGKDQLSITHESLQTIGQEQDQWRDRQGLTGPNHWIPSEQVGNIRFISTEEIENGTTLIHLHHEEDAEQETMLAKEMRQTALSQVTSAKSPHAFAVREEMHHWKRLQLNPEALRQPSPIDAPPFLSPEGQNLAATLARMQRDAAFFMADVRLYLTGLVPGIGKIKLDTDYIPQHYTVRVAVDEQTPLPSPMLSEGTLRMLALATLRNDPEHYGVLCFEEPEMGALPSRLPDVARTLRDLATDLHDEEHTHFPLRQLLATTQSPAFISQQKVRDALLFTHMPTRIRPRNKAVPPHGITDIERVVNSPEELKADLARGHEGAHYVLGRARDYLRSEILDEARDDFARRIDFARTINA